ncbi:glycosyltransferase family 4 protein [Marinitoga sp. 1138]|uniref:glycosyltransferase family 4 protein n=1 Tax=Marinitoga sp. 1138 TaxID=1643334 RepID=UPI0015864942|nr:glycosyltransferase family 4 protein [Marinitoga sp. 1138]NUU97766.1 hypothetical protein [Marinitoga sp. 1138]
MYEILHVVYAPSFMIGGINSYVNEIFKFTKSKNHNIGIVYIDKIVNSNSDLIIRDKKKIKKIYRIYKSFYDLLPLKIKEYIKLKSIEKNLLKIKDKINKDTIFHIHSVLLYDIIRKNFKDNKIILTLHGYYTYEHLSDGDIKVNSKQFYNMLNLEKNIYTKVDAVIAVDKNLFEHCKKLSPNANVFMKPNFVDNLKFKPISKDKKIKLKKQFNVEHKLVFLTTRRLELKNGVHILAKAITLLSDEIIKNSVFFIVGDGSERTKIEKILSNTNASIKLLGSIPHEGIVTYYQLSDVFIIPSINTEGVEEATSISTLEAMACGNIVIASNIGGLKILIEDNKNGFLVEQNNALQLKEKIEYVYNNYKNLENIKLEARNTIEKKFSIENYYVFLNNLYNKVRVN